MSRHSDRVRPGSDRAGLYDEITGRIVAKLEAGRVPWVQPWGTTAAKAALGLPRSASIGRTYSGINVLILWGAVIQHGFPNRGWLTFRRALALGGHVRKGERGTTFVYAIASSPTTSGLPCYALKADFAALLVRCFRERRSNGRSPGFRRLISARARSRA